MLDDLDRRGFLKLAGLGAGVTFASGLGFKADPALAADSDFYFVQLTDTHWGFSGPKVNPEALNTLPKAVAAVNALATPPDFIVFTGDLTHTTDDPLERRKRMAQFKAIVGELKVKTIRYLAGEHDASLDKGEAFREFFGEMHYAFDHKGVHFIALDNVSDPGAKLGEAQLDWLKADLAKQKPEQSIVVLTHRPLFDLYPDWDWATQDGAKAIDLLMPYKNVAVLYGHIHQEHHKMTQHIAHHAATSLIFPQPAPGSQPKRTPPVEWDPAHPFRGLGFREIAAKAKVPAVTLAEVPLVKA
ncbi:MAG: metallophosphoesterase [Proteobacteria bacterium]|nr:metallophosphoesterase [Pseudomonadota bacterium]MBI3496181.1 metallophosphoesterase [Pseudomonadota bacterium]